MNWEQMSARERDALVAEKVMGWTDFSPIDPKVDFTVGVNGLRRNFARSPDGRQTWFPNFTTHISAAWEVVEKMQTLKFDMSLFWISGTRWECVFHGLVGSGGGHVTGRDAPEAICLAALRAVGVEV